MADNEKHVLQLIDEDGDAYRDADRLLPRCEPEGDVDEDFIRAANLIVLWDGHPTRLGLLPSDEMKKYLLPVWEAAKKLARLKAQCMAEDQLPIESVAETYHRLTGNNLADLPPKVQERFLFLPPDAEWDDIEFVLDPPPHTLEGAAPRIYGRRKPAQPKD
jgi:hypothetical protein